MPVTHPTEADRQAYVRTLQRDGRLVAYETHMRNKAGEVVAFMKKADSQQHIAEHGGSALPLSEALAMLP